LGLLLLNAFSSQTLSFEGYLYRYTELENSLIQENGSQIYLKSRLMSDKPDGRALTANCQIGLTESEQYLGKKKMLLEFLYGSWLLSAAKRGRILYLRG